jgi:pimeloyl-ACP methyl ester carboxylesterase
MLLAGRDDEREQPVPKGDAGMRTAHATRDRVGWRAAGSTVTAMLMLVAVAVVGASTPARADHEPALPIVFVHGFSGSAAQYETQALRWASNDYPNVVTAIDRTSSTPAVIYPALDQFFDDVMAQTGDDQIYVVAHSLGTSIMYGYLASAPERAARVAKYIGIDGLSNASCPGGVECMGLWARGSSARVLGPTNVRLDDQGHTQSVGSAESFAAQYEFLLGHAPRTTLVLPEPPGRVEISGRVLNYPANTGIDGSTLSVYLVDDRTGARRDPEPRHTVSIGADGNFGPLSVNGQQRYELEVTRQGPDGPLHHHFYSEPFLRSNSLLRLNLSPIGSDLSNAIQRGPHTSVSIVRQKEWWGANTVDPTNVDALDVTTTTGGGVESAGNIINGATAPYAASTIAIISFDIGVDGVSDTSALAPLGPFLSGIDAYMPATEPPDGTITFTHQQRRAGQQVIATPNWSSEAGHGMTVTFRDWTQTVNTWGDCKRAKPSPCS